MKKDLIMALISLAIFVLIASSFSPKANALPGDVVYNPQQTKILEENFDGDLSGWTNIVESPNVIDLATNNIKSGKSLHLNYVSQQTGTGGYISAEKTITSTTDVLARVFFYDDLQADKGTIFQLWADDPSSNILSFLGVNTTISAENYVWRKRKGGDYSLTFDTRMKRTAGWHMFEFVVNSNYGTCAKIDNEVISFNNNGKWEIACHPDAKNLTKIAFMNTWGGQELKGESWWDNLLVTTQDSQPWQNQFYTSFRDFYQTYGSIDFSQTPLYTDLAQGRNMRNLSNLALNFYIYGKIFNDQIAINKGRELFLYGLNHCNWNQLEGPEGGIDRAWLRGATMLSFANTALTMRLDFDRTTWSQIEQKIIAQANLYLTPVGETATATDWQNQWPRTGHLADTKAEENALNAGFLSLAANLFSNQANSSLWERRARCFAFHSFSVDEADLYDSDCLVYRREGDTYVRVPGGRSQTIIVQDSSHWELQNHCPENTVGQCVSPVYGVSSTQHLATGALYYLLTNKAIPQEFRHNVIELYEKFLISQIEVNPETYFFSYYYQFPPLAYSDPLPKTPGRDWGGTYNTLYHGAPLFLGYLDQLGYSHGIPWQSLMAKKSLFYYQTNGWYYEPFSQSRPFDYSRDSTRVLINAVEVAEVYFPALLLKNFYEFPLPPGDLNRDFQINSQDLVILLQNWGSSPSNPQADLNSDGVVNGMDFEKLRKLIP